MSSPPPPPPPQLSIFLRPCFVCIIVIGVVDGLKAYWNKDKIIIYVNQSLCKNTVTSSSRVYCVFAKSAIAILELPNRSTRRCLTLLVN